MDTLKPFLDRRLAGREVEARPKIEQVATLRWQRDHRADAHGGPADLQLQRRQARSTASCRPTTASRAASSPRCRTPGTAPGANKMADHHRPGRRRSRRSSSINDGVAELDDLQGHPPAGRTGRDRGRGVSCRSRRPTVNDTKTVRQRREGCSVVPARPVETVYKDDITKSPDRHPATTRLRKSRPVRRSSSAVRGSVTGHRAPTAATGR